MTYKTMMMTCSVLHTRGQQVKAFNLPPFYYNKFKKKTVKYRDRLIPLISEGWVEVEGMNYILLDTREGTVFNASGYAVL